MLLTATNSHKRNVFTLLETGATQHAKVTRNVAPRRNVICVTMVARELESRQARSCCFNSQKSTHEWRTGSLPKNEREDSSTRKGIAYIYLLCRPSQTSTPSTPVQGAFLSPAFSHIDTEQHGN